MTITELEMNELLMSVASKGEREIALVVFSIQSVLREVISLIASYPEKLENIGGPIKAVERVAAAEGECRDMSEPQVFNVEVSVDAMGENMTVSEEVMEVAEPMEPLEEVTEAIIDPLDEEEAVEGIGALPTSEHTVDTSYVEQGEEAADLDDSLEVTTITSTDGETVRVHIQSVEKRARPRVTRSIDSINMHPCSHCSMSFMRLFELQRHITVKHTNEKKFVCVECGKRFALKVYLNNHIRCKHLPDAAKPYGCPHCAYRCILPSLLSRHMERHTNEKSFKCEVCGQYFYAVKQLKHHMYRHQEKTLQCAYCDFKTANPYRLTSHHKQHTSTEVFTCEHCNFTTNVKADMSKHVLNLHTKGEFSCKFCDLRFKRPTNLKRHQYVHKEKTLECTHSDCTWRTADPYELKRHEREHMDGKKHVCEICGFKFHRPFDLKKHMKTHSKIHQCCYCAAVFADSHELSCHKRRRHSKRTEEVTLVYEDDCSQADRSLTHEFTEDDAGVKEETARQLEEDNITSGRTVVINQADGQQIIFESGVNISQPHDFIVSDSDQQLLEMASAIIAQVGEGSAEH